MTPFSGAERCVVVLGGGINGAALARELTLSGVSVAVVDAGDIASGATAWSTRLVHGGLRYLEHGEVSLVRESLAERDRLVRLAPHLVRPLEFYLPVQARWGGLFSAAAGLVGWGTLARAWRGTRGRGAWTVGLGLSLYDLLSVGSRWPRHRMVRAGSRGLPAVDAGRFPLAGIYADAQMLFPERFTVELLLDAQQIAAAAGTSFSVHTHSSVRMTKDGTLHITPHQAAGRNTTLRPAALINATGAWVDRTLEHLLPTPADTPQPLIGGTQGSHLVVRSAGLRGALGESGVYAEADDGRPVFVLPFGPRLVLVGTTDIPFSGDPHDARTSAAEIAYLCAAVGRLFPLHTPLPEQIQQHYCGVRPLPGPGCSGGSGATPGAITRRHLLVRHPGGPVPIWSIVGGKLTTCRSLAETAAAEVMRCLGLPVLTTSRQRPLPGAPTIPETALLAQAAASARQAGLEPAEALQAAAQGVALFGARAPLMLAESQRAAGGGKIVRGTNLPVGIVGACVRLEWATDLEDVIERRLMLVFAEGLTRGTLEDVAQGLVEAGVLEPEAAGAAVTQCLERLLNRFGRNINFSRAEPES